MTRYPGTELFRSKRRFMNAMRDSYPSRFQRARRGLDTRESRIRRALKHQGA